MAKLGDVCKVVSGSTPDSNNSSFWDGEYPWITPAEIDDESRVVIETRRKITVDGIKKTGLKPFPTGTVILSSRAPIGKVAIAGTEMFCNQGFKNLICSSQIYNYYLFWFLKSKTDFLNSLGRGATFKEISKSIVEKIEIPLPSLVEQHRVATELDKASGLIALRKRQLELLDELVKARFIEMFGDPLEEKQSYKIERLSDIAEIKIGPFGSMLHESDYIVNGIPVINPSNITNDKILPDINHTVTQEKYDELYSYKLLLGDIVLGRRGEMGRCAVVETEGLLCGTGSLIIRSSSRMRPYILQKILSHPTYRSYIADKSVGVTMQNLNVSIVGSFLIPEYPIELQDEFILLSKKIDQLRLEMLCGLDTMETSYNALLQEYFG